MNDTPTNHTQPKPTEHRPWCDVALHGRDSGGHCASVTWTLAEDFTVWLTQGPDDFDHRLVFDFPPSHPGLTGDELLELERMAKEAQLGWYWQQARDAGNGNETPAGGAA
jgi:hypothetical protein